MERNRQEWPKDYGILHQTKLKHARLRALEISWKDCCCSTRFEAQNPMATLKLIIEVVVQNARPDGCPIMKQMKNQE